VGRLFAIAEPRAARMGEDRAARLFLSDLVTFPRSKPSVERRAAPILPRRTTDSAVAARRCFRPAAARNIEPHSFFPSELGGGQSRS